MPRKFVYAPGLPGYGTRGVDGSTGLLGIATYFSAYDGNSDTVTIKSKIIANKELFSTDTLLPGYPDRVYQDGDIFIDPNARVFQIDLNEANLYAPTGIFLNTSGFFTAGPVQASNPQFERYSNSFETDKFLIDVAYTHSVGDYTLWPSAIYGLNPRYFGRVDYMGSDVQSDLVASFSAPWYPFQVWTIGSTNNKDSIALARENTDNAWHFGNYEEKADVSLYLDFGDVYGAENIHGNFLGSFSGTITSTDLFLPGDLNVNGDVSIGGTLYGGSPIKFGDAIQFAQTPGIIQGLPNGGGVGGDVDIRGGLGSSQPNHGNIYIGTSQTDNIYLGDETVIPSGYTPSTTIPEVLFMDTGSGANQLKRGFFPVRSYTSSGVRGRVITATSTANYLEGNDELLFDDFSNINFGNLILGSNNDSYPISCGIRSGTIGSAAGSDGKTLNFAAGDGVDQVGPANGGDGGQVYIRGGNGGGDGAGLGGGLGGSITMDPGLGHSITGIAGDGGDMVISSGGGGYGGSSGDKGGDAGHLRIQGGTGGHSTSDRAGDGGHVSIQGGFVGQDLVGSLEGLYAGDVSISGGGWPSTYGGDVNLNGGQGSTTWGNINLWAGGGDINLHGQSGDVIITGIRTQAGGTGLYNLQMTSAGILYRDTNSGTSDIRLKTIDSSIVNVLPGLKTLSAIKYHYNQTAVDLMDADPSTTNYGLIAQEVQSSFPELVQTYEGEADASAGDPSIWYGLNYLKFVPVLVQGINEQQEIIESLETDVSTLTYENEGMANDVSALAYENDGLTNDVSTLTYENVGLTNDVSILLYAVSDLTTRVEALEASIG